MYLAGENHPQPLDPKTMKNEGFTPKIWIITPKNEGCGFPWNHLAHLLFDLLGNFWAILFQSSWKLIVKHQLDMGVSLNGGTPKTPQNDHF